MSDDIRLIGDSRKTAIVNTEHSTLIIDMADLQETGLAERAHFAKTTTHFCGIVELSSQSDDCMKVALMWKTACCRSSNHQLAAQREDYSFFWHS